MSSFPIHSPGFKPWAMNWLAVSIQTMKTLYLVRHAKSSWKYPELADIDRPLNKRGKKDAPKMAEYVVNKIDRPGVFISSPSKRTKVTGRHFLTAFGLTKKELEIDPDLYHGYEEDIDLTVSRLDDQLDSAMLFIHNPSITSYVNHKTGAGIANIPTCAIAAINLDMDSWKKIDETNGELAFYFYPKGLVLP